MRRWAAVITMVLSFSFAAHAQAGDYDGGRVVLRTSPYGRAAGHAGRLRLRIQLSARDSTRAELTMRSGPSDTGWAMRWSDTLVMMTWRSTGDTILWIGHRRGAGYAGYYAHYRANGAGEFGKWALNFTGDSLRKSPPPPMTARASSNAWFASLAAAVPGHPRAIQDDTPEEDLNPNAGTGEYAFWWIVISVFAIALYRDGRAKWSKRRAARRPIRPSTASLYGYAVPCPICGVARIQEARILHVIRGRGLFTSLDSRTVAGCSRCVRGSCGRAIAGDFVGGLHSLGGLLASPFYSALNLRGLLRHPDPTIVESLIRKVGLDPDAVRLDGDGLTPAERRRVVIASFVASTLVWANGHRAPKGFDMSLTYIHSFLEGKLIRGRIGEILFESHASPSPACTLSNDERAIMARWMRNLALADGPLTEQMSAAIFRVANALGFSKHDITELFKEIGYAARGTSGAEEARREARAKQSSTNGNQQQHQEDPRARRHRRMREDLEKARILLGVSSTASYGEIERAYRTIIAACHPDRAGLDPRLQKLFTEKAQQITWAKEALRRSFQAQA